MSPSNQAEWASNLLDQLKVEGVVVTVNVEEDLAGALNDRCGQSCGQCGNWHCGK